MCDTFVKTCLIKWNLEKYITSFEDEEIDEEAFRMISQATIDKIFVKSGPRDKFQACWQKEFAITGIISNAEIFIDNSAVPHLDLTDKINPVGDKENQLIVPIDIPEEPGIDIETLLKNSIEGKVVLNNLQKNTLLTNEERIQIADVILRSELKEENGFCISSTRLEYLAKQIVIFFPNEIKETYYVPFKIDSVTRKPILAKGKLHLRYYKLREKLKRSGESLGNERKRRSKEANNQNSRDLVLVSEEQLQSSEANLDEVIEAITWLKNNLSPWSEITYKWSLTSKYRIQEIASNVALTSSMIFSTYNCLEQPSGYELIDLDFNDIYPDKQNNLTAKWDSFEKEVVEIAKTRKFKEMTNLLEEYKLKDDAPFVSVPIVLRILPLLLPPQMVKGIGSKQIWKLSRAESQNGFVAHITNVSQLSEFLEHRRAVLQKYKLTEQPLIVIVGENLLNIHTSYVCINKTRYIVDSPLKALNITFKSFYSLQLKYPKETDNVWKIIQYRIFRIGDGECEEVPPNVKTLLADFAKVNCDFISKEANSC